MNRSRVRRIRPWSSLAALVVVTLVGTGCAFVERVSVSSTGEAGDADSSSDASGTFSRPGPSITADGHYVAFTSEASNLVPGDTNDSGDVFVRDVLTGTTERVSLDSAGNEANGRSAGPSISADGRYVAFGSGASNLVPGDSNGVGDVFVRDRVAGITERVSVTSAGTEADGGSGDPSISTDGRYVAFTSFAPNLVPVVAPNATGVLVRDRQAGTTELVSGRPPVISSLGSAMSGDGRYVAFTSYVVVGTPMTEECRTEMRVRDQVAQSTHTVWVTSSSACSFFQPWPANAQSSLSKDGRHVAFTSSLSDLVTGDTNGALDVFVWDRLTDSTERASLDSAGDEANRASSEASISADGRHVAFNSQASDLVSGDTNGSGDVFVRDRLAGTTQRASVDAFGGQANGTSRLPSISANGRYVTFASQASNLVEGDTSGFWDVFVTAHPRPVVGEVVPAALPRDATTSIAIHGSGFTDDATVAIAQTSEGISLSNINVVDGSEITADVTVAPDAPLGTRNVYVQLRGTGPGIVDGALAALGMCHRCVHVEA